MNDQRSAASGTPVHASSASTASTRPAVGSIARRHRSVAITVWRPRSGVVGRTKAAMVRSRSRASAGCGDTSPHDPRRYALLPAGSLDRGDRLDHRLPEAGPVARCLRADQADDLRPVGDRRADHDLQRLARLDAHRVGVAGDRECVGGRQQLRHRANSSTRAIEHLIEFDGHRIYSGPRAPTPGPHPRAPVERPAGAVQPGRPRLVRGLVRGPDARAVRRLGGDLGRPPHADPCPDGQRQDARGLPLVHRPADPARERASQIRRRAASACCTSRRSRR